MMSSDESYSESVSFYEEDESYSSEWDRDSSSDYYDSESDEPRRERPRIYRPISPLEELNFDLVTLPRPTFKHVVWGGEEKKEEKTNEEEKKIVKAPINPWKKIDKNIVPPYDPWAFLEKKPEPPQQKQEKQQQEKQQQENNKLCKYRNECQMNKRGNCNMVHSVNDWRPRICRFDTTCRRKNTCGYHHSDVPIRIFLANMIKKRDTIYNKNSSLYSKYL